MMYFKLVIRNTRRSVCDYLLYMLTMTILTAILTAANYITVTGNEQAGFQTASLPPLITLILVILVRYINRFLLKQRAKEFANYMLLGMEKNKLSWVFLLEFQIVGVLCFTAGVLAGTGIFLTIFYLMLHTLEGFELQMFLIGKGLLYTFFYFCAVEILSSFPIRREMKKLQISELMIEKKRNQKAGGGRSIRFWGVWSAIGFFCFMGLLTGIAYLPETLSFPMISFISVPLLVTIVAFYKWQFLFLTEKRQRQADFLFRKNRLLRIAQITSGTNTNAVMISIFCICLVFSAMSFLFGIILLQPETETFVWQNQQWMGFLQICLSIIFAVLYFSILSLQQIMELRRRAGDMRILRYIGNDGIQLRRIIQSEIMLTLYQPAFLCFLLMIVAIPLLDYKLNALFPPTLNHILIKASGAFALCFLLLYLCYSGVVYIISRRFYISI